MAISTQQKRNATRKLSISPQVIKARGQPLKSSDFVITNVDAEMLFRDAPFAKANKGYRIALLDEGLEGQIIYSDGRRYRAEGGQLIFTPTFNTDPTRGNTLIKHAEIKIPYSNKEGSLWHDGDLLELAVAHQRYGTANTGSILTRSIMIGKNQTITDNTLLFEWPAAATNQKGFADNPLIFGRRDATTIRAFGNYTKWDNWNGATSSDDQYDTNGTTSFDNMDRYDTYIQVGLKFDVAPAADAARVMFFRAILQTCGE